MDKRLVITNYDNFKNADFFKQQYLKAQEMIKETNEFFNSFCMSKLLTAKDALNISPVLISSYQTWINYFVFPDYEYNEQVECLLKGKKYKESTYPNFKSISNDEAKKKCKEYSKILIQDFNKIIDKNPEYDCYFVLDKYNILHDFIPVKCKDTISIDFLGDDISISGYFYDYYEYGERFGKCGYRISKITRKIIINGATNNVEKIETNITQIEEGTVAHKSYWDNHISYAMTSREEDNIKTINYKGIRRQIHAKYKRFRELNRHSCGLYGTTKDFYELAVEQFNDEYNKMFGRNITIEYVENCCNSWN